MIGCRNPQPEPPFPQSWSIELFQDFLHNFSDILALLLITLGIANELESQIPHRQSLFNSNFGGIRFWLKKRYD